jgi:ATP-dependent Clp protease adapter protein ClpS
MEEVELDFSEDLNALVESEATLSDEFKGKAAVIFEAAVKSKLSQEIDRLEEQYQTQLDEEVQATKNELVEKVDSYLNYVVENWMKENQLAIQNGLRTEIAEAFMGKLKDLFTESYIEVPESKVDLVDELAEEVEALEGKLNEATEQAIENAKLLEGYQREAVIREAAKDLADTEVEKLKGLVEDVDFEDEATFANKVKTIKESYFNKKTVEAQDLEEEVEDNGEGVVTEEVSDLMSSYISAIRKVKK